MARISSGIATSHVPAIGAALDLGKVDEPYWRPETVATIDTNLNAAPTARSAGHIRKRGDEGEVA